MPAPAAGNVAGYLEWMRQRGFTAETITGRRRFLYRTARALGVPLDEATETQLAAYRAGLTITDRAIERYVSHLRAYYNWAIEEGHRTDSPARRIPVPRTGRLLPRPISEQHLADAIITAARDVRLALVLSAWCGLRAKEIALLRRENILDTAREPVLIVAADATKGHTERAVPLCPFVLRELELFGLPGFGFIIARRDGKPGPVRPARVSQLAGDHLRSLGIPACLHMGRHRFGGEFYEGSGTDLLATADVMGHASVNTTRGYAALHPARSAEVVAALPVPQSLAGLPAAA
jgi:integrase